MITNLPELHEPGAKILLSEDSPLFFLNMNFPEGIPVPNWLLSLNGRDFFEVCFEEVYSRGLWQQISAVLWQEQQMGDLVAYCVSQYRSVPIPCEWAIEIPG